MATTLLLKAGIVVGGYIIARIAARYVSEEPEAPIGQGWNGGGNPQNETRRSNIFRNTENRSEVPEDETRRSYIFRNTENRSEVPEDETRRSNIFRNTENRSEVPEDETRRSNRFRNTENRSEVPEPPLSTPTRLPEIQKTLDSSIQHDKGPSTSTLHNPETAHQRNWPSTNPILYVAPSDPANPQSKTSYISAQEDRTSPIFAIPEDLRDLIKKDIVPRVLKQPVSPSTYKDYFDALLYAEDYYNEKWDGFEMKDVNLELHEAAIRKRKGKYTNLNVNDENDDNKVFVAFDLDSIPERRPFLLSRDFVYVRPSGKDTEPFQGLVYRVVNSNRVLVDFGEDFHYQHSSACKYNVKFSFNRVCLKRAHQAVAAALNPLFRNFLFPDSIPNNNHVSPQLRPISSELDQDQISAVCRILSHQNLPPYLLEGQLSVNQSKQLSRTGLVVCEAILQIHRTSPSCRILICAPLNSTCDAITRKLKNDIRESHIFRANAAFRELDGVPFDILPNCVYQRECFSCPSLQELRKFKVIVSTFMSSFRLHNEGIMAGHFSHIFLVDASSATEPETMVALANLAKKTTNLAKKTTAVILTGAPGTHSRWIRSNIARHNGLMTSYFERLRGSKLYNSLDPKVITQL